MEQGTTYTHVSNLVIDRSDNSSFELEISFLISSGYDWNPMASSFKAAANRYLNAVGWKLYEGWPYPEVKANFPSGNWVTYAIQRK